MGSEWRTTAYDRYVSSHYSQLNRLDLAGYRDAANTYGRTWDQALPRSRDVACLDLGCGGGQFMYYLRSRGFRNIQGVDLSQENVELAASLGFDVQHADAKDFLRSRSGSKAMFGLISLIDVVEHLSREEVFDILRLAHTALADDGVLLIKTVNAACILGTYHRYMDITHEMAFSEDSMSQLLNICGYRRVQLLPTLSRDWKDSARRMLRGVLYFLLYRIVEGRSKPVATDFDLKVYAGK